MTLLIQEEIEEDKEEIGEHFELYPNERSPIGCQSFMLKRDGIVILQAPLTEYTEDITQLARLSYLRGRSDGIRLGWEEGYEDGHKECEHYHSKWDKGE